MPLDFLKLLEPLKGYRTYAAAAALAVTAVVQFRAGDVMGAAQSALGALAAFGLRSALTDLLPKPPAAHLPTVAAPQPPEQNQQPLT